MKMMKQAGPERLSLAALTQIAAVRFEQEIDHPGNKLTVLVPEVQLSDVFFFIDAVLNLLNQLDHIGERQKLREPKIPELSR